jgi:dihydropyrimidine dehydrogenase (NAD+) subunit PreT
VFADLHPAFTPQEALVEANRCLFCFDAPCAQACPTHIDVPRFIKKLATGNLRGAAVTILDANLLGASCSRVCPVEVLCEGSCVLHRYNKQPIEIGRLQRRAMEFRTSDLPAFPAPARQLNIACIGSGPASLSCAGELARRGHRVTVFEARPLPGGLNTYGVAEYKLQTKDALAEVAFIESLGVEIRCNETVDAERLQQIADEHHAVFLGLGLGRMDALGLPGEDLVGVIDALRFIAAYKTEKDITVGRRVVVIGAGNTAIDAAAAAKRLGAEEVVMLYRRTAAEMSAFTFEYKHAKQEEVAFSWLARPISILGEDGKVTGLACERLPSGDTFVIPCDLVIPAIGQSKNGELLASTTGNPKFYAGGDLTNGGREVVDAVADGKRAALKMMKDLHA